MSRSDILRRVAACLSLLLLVDALYLAMLHLGSVDVHDRVAAPSYAALLDSYRETVSGYADVEWHIGLIEGGYEKADAAEAPPSFWKQQRNWAFFPLTPWLAGLLTSFTGSPFWSLWWLGQVSLLVLLLGFDAWSREAVSDPARRQAGWGLLVFFALPPVAYSVNFIILPLTLLAYTGYGLSRWLDDSEEVGPWLWIAAVGSLLFGVSRVQGLVFNAAVLALLAVRTLWVRPRPSNRDVSVLAAANLLPAVAIGGLFLHYANHPFAFQKIQLAWGRSLSAPWTPWIDYVQSGFVLNLFHDELLLTGMRFAIFLAFALAALRVLVIDRGVLRELRERRGGMALFQVWGVGLALVFLLMPMMSHTLLSAHRYASFGFLGLWVWLCVGGRVSLLALALVLLMRIGEMTLFFQGVRAFVW